MTRNRATKRHRKQENPWGVTSYFQRVATEQGDNLSAGLLMNGVLARGGQRSVREPIHRRFSETEQ